MTYLSIREKTKSRTKVDTGVELFYFSVSSTGRRDVGYGFRQGLVGVVYHLCGDGSTRCSRNPMAASGGVVTQLLAAWQAGDETAKNKLFALLYEDLHQIAREQRNKWQGSGTLNTTALLHELYLRLSRQGTVRPQDRGQFNRFVAKALRWILMNYARDQGRQRRGGDWVKIPLDLDALPEEEALVVEMQAHELLAIDSALSKLSALNARLAEVVELRFYGGLTHEEIAQSLDIAKRTVTRDWAQAKMLLRRIMQEPSSPPDHGD